MSNGSRISSSAHSPERGGSAAYPERGWLSFVAPVGVLLPCLYSGIFIGLLLTPAPTHGLELTQAQGRVELGTLIDPSLLALPGQAGGPLRASLSLSIPAGEGALGERFGQSRLGSAEGNLDVEDQGLFSPTLILDLPILQGNLQVGFGRLLGMEASLSAEDWGATVFDSLGNDRLRIQSEVAGGGMLSAEWDLLRIAYQLPLGKDFQLGIGLLHHQVGLAAEGSFRGESRFEAESGGSFVSGTYGEDQFAGQWKGEATGDGWTPEACLRWGPFQGCSRFGATFRLEGPWSSELVAPFYHALPTLDLTLDAPDQLSDGAAMEQLGTAATHASVTPEGTRGSWDVQVPQVHQLEATLFPDHLALGYARMLGSWSIIPMGGDPSADGRNHLAWSFSPRHLAYTWVAFWQLRIDAGLLLAKTGSQESFSRGLPQARLPEQWAEWTGIPLLGLEWSHEWGDWGWRLGWSSAPLSHLRAEVSHVW